MFALFVHSRFIPEYALEIYYEDHIIVSTFDMRIGLILLPLPILLGTLSFTRWIKIPTGYAVGLEVIFIIIAVSMKK